MQKIVDTINTLDVDYVLIAGDFTYHPKTTELKTLFSPFKSLKKPAYAILGNHDVGLPGPIFKSELTLALTQDKVRVLENEIVPLDGFSLIGL